jgi:predicted phosphatase
MRKRKSAEPIPEEFETFEQAAEFWDTHDTTQYPEAFRTVKMVGQLRHRRFEIPLAPDVAETLRKRARQRGVSLGHLTNELLRRNLNILR